MTKEVPMKTFKPAYHNYYLYTFDSLHCIVFWNRKHFSSFPHNAAGIYIYSTIYVFPKELKKPLDRSTVQYESMNGIHCYLILIPINNVHNRNAVSSTQAYF